MLHLKPLRLHNTSRMKKILVIISVVICSQTARAQQFLNKAVIEFEVVANVEKNLFQGGWADMYKENLPKFKTGYYTYTFSGNQSVFKFDHWGGPTMPKFMTASDEENKWYYDFDKNFASIRKQINGAEFTMEGAIDSLQWKLTNENRVIAGFNCRKAVTQIMDSVYVFAFYTDEILIPGGPCSIHGLPGMILGMTIPRLYTSWMATKVMVNDVDTRELTARPAKKVYSKQEITGKLEEVTNDWYSDDAEQNKNIKEYKARMIWNTLL